MTRDGYLLTQDDPYPHAQSVVAVLMGAEERLFEYDVTTVESDEHGRELDVAWYREKEDRMPDEDVIEVEPCPDLNDMRYVGGVRLVLPGGPVVDLPATRAAKLAEAIISVLYQTGRLKPTI